VNDEVVLGVGVSVTDEPCSNEALQVLPQLMPSGELVTEPSPVPDLITSSVRNSSLNVAMIDVASFIVSSHGPVPEHSRAFQPTNDELGAAVAVSVTCVPAWKAWEHSDPHSMPSGDADTVPVPEPPISIVKVLRESARDGSAYRQADTTSALRAIRRARRWPDRAVGIWGDPSSER
jgi:hypothetical protein